MAFGYLLDSNLFTIKLLFQEMLFNLLEEAGIFSLDNLIRIYDLDKKNTGIIFIKIILLVRVKSSDLFFYVNKFDKILLSWKFNA